MSSVLSFLLLSVATSAFAQESTVEPYIDRIRSKIGGEGREATAEGSYTEEIKKTLKPAPQTGQSYIDAVKAAHPERFDGPAPGSSNSYLESKKWELGPKEGEPSAISAFHAGKTKLELKREGAIHHAFSFRMGASQNRTVTDQVSGQNFSTLYGDAWAPDLTGYYEFQPFHSEWFGNIGIVLGGGLTYHDGKGTFKFNVTNPVTGVGFGTSSRTKFQFFTVPAFAGLNYRFNLFRLFRPYVQATPTLIGYWEKRSDAKDGSGGTSTGVVLSGGVNILLDWFSRDSAWALYETGGVKHYYVTVDYSRLSTFTGDVRFAVSGLSAGMTFEF